MQNVIDATRGKPSTKQIMLCEKMLDPLDSYIGNNGVDARNYGGYDGLWEMKELFAQLLDITPNEVIVGGNSSLNMMFDCMATLILTGLWGRNGTKMLCPVPGYDRHFAICEYLGIEMINVPMTQSGPDMDIVETLVKDPSVAGIWCVPVFSNPQGYIYSNEVIKQLAKMQAAHPHFKIFWDNAYAIHHFRGDRPCPVNILYESVKHGHGSRPLIFTSFSKISIPGAAVVCLAGNEQALSVFRKRTTMQTIGPDKINQLRHVNFFSDLAGIEVHMKKHADILRPKFELIIDVFNKKLPLLNTEFTNPDGGYFISVETPRGYAKYTQQLCKEAGVLLTTAGASFPYGKDPNDSNLRIAPSFLSISELEHVLDIFCCSLHKALHSF